MISFPFLITRCSSLILHWVCSCLSLEHFISLLFFPIMLKILIHLLIDVLRLLTSVPYYSKHASFYFTLVSNFFALNQLCFIHVIVIPCKFVLFMFEYIKIKRNMLGKYITFKLSLNVLSAHGFMITIIL